MDIIKTVVYFLLVLSVLVIVHEWGHFIVAKLCRMRVEDFSLFFGKRLIRLGERNGTEYNIRTVPLGGFVKIAGMEPDDISNGAPIFKRRNSTANRPEKTLRGLREEALEGIQLDNVSERVRQAVEQAIGSDAQLTSNGREELQALLHSTSINSDEHRYLEAILGAAMDMPDPNGYNQKPIWQRAAVIFAGPLMSLFFGYALFCMMGFTTGLPNLENLDNTIGEVVKGKAADRAGLKAGDKIIQINGVPIRTWESMAKLIHENANHPIHLVVQRDGQTIPYTVTPEAVPVTVEENGKKVSKLEGRLSIGPNLVFNWKRYTPIAAVKRGTAITYFEITGTIQTLFSPHVRENIGGPVAIAKIIHDDSKQGFRQVMFTAAMLSVSLGLVNLFPIPILDGGHLMLLAIEGIRRRKLSSREVATWQMVGLSIICVLFVLVMYNDILRLLPKP
ncbi:MAG TPA: M50 family metallopeptidase [Chthonomonadaceae bacterium]|nr:M50 family metallopeptidase [Chthonomonadaceae bacterium]